MVWQNSHQTLYCFSGVGSKAPLRPSLALLSINQNQERTPIDLHLTENVTWKELTAHRPLGRQKALEGDITIPTECKARATMLPGQTALVLPSIEMLHKFILDSTPLGIFFGLK